jgi:hypothetical protein
MKAHSNIKKSILAIAACAAVGAVGYAAVSIDSEGLGFVGKGDVQLAADLNNAQLQAAAGTISFKYQSVEEWTWECEWYTGPTHNRTHHTVPRTLETGVNSSVAYDVKLSKGKTPQITGFNLNGFAGDPEEVSGTPGHCEAGKTLVAGSLEQVGDETGGLQVSVNGTWYPLAITPQ